MSDRVRQLAERRTALRLRCAAQRNAIASEVGAVLSRLESVDRFVAAGRRALRQPVVIGAAVLVLILLGRARSFRLLGHGLLLMSAVRKLMRLGATGRELIGPQDPAAR